MQHKAAAGSGQGRLLPSDLPIGAGDTPRDRGAAEPANITGTAGGRGGGDVRSRRAHSRLRAHRTRGRQQASCSPIGAAEPGRETGITGCGIIAGITGCGGIAGIRGCGGIAGIGLAGMFAGMGAGVPSGYLGSNTFSTGFPSAPRDTHEPGGASLGGGGSPSSACFCCCSGMPIGMPVGMGMGMGMGIGAPLGRPMGTGIGAPICIGAPIGIGAPICIGAPIGMPGCGIIIGGH